MLVIVMAMFCVLRYELSWCTSFILQRDSAIGQPDKGFAWFCRVLKQMLIWHPNTYLHRIFLMHPRNVEHRSFRAQATPTLSQVSSLAALQIQNSVQMLIFVFLCHLLSPVLITFVTTIRSGHSLGACREYVCFHIVCIILCLWLQPWFIVSIQGLTMGARNSYPNRQSKINVAT
jgi:hypothetical protein